MFAILPLGRRVFNITLPLLRAAKGLCTAESGRYDGRLPLLADFRIFCAKKKMGLWHLVYCFTNMCLTVISTLRILTLVKKNISE